MLAQSLLPVGLQPFLVLVMIILRFWGSNLAHPLPGIGTLLLMFNELG
jgi:hypothetical protein